MKKASRGCACPRSRLRLRRRHSLAWLALTALLAAVLFDAAGDLTAGPATAWAAGATEAPIGLSSTTAGGAQGDGPSNHASLSADGRYTAFASDAGNLVAGDNNGKRDIFVKDNQTGKIILISTDSRGSLANLESDSPVISADGRYVTFESRASNLAASSLSGDTNNKKDIFIKDTQTGATRLVSTSSSGGGANGDSLRPSLSADGRYIAFESDAGNLVKGLLILPGDSNGKRDIFVKDLQTGKLSRVSTSAADKQSNGHSYGASLSADGQLVAFESDATNLVSGDSNNKKDIFVKNVSSKEVKLASTGSSGSHADADCLDASLSGDGKLVAFASLATNLAGPDGNGKSDIFVKNLQSGATSRASLDGQGAEPNGGSYRPALSRDGSRLAFESDAANLVSGDSNGKRDIFVKNLPGQEISRASRSAAGSQGDRDSFAATLGADGTRLAFESDATNLVSDSNGKRDIFQAPLTTAGVTPPPPPATARSYFLTWYDNNPAWGMYGNAILIANLGSSAAEVKILINHTEVASFDAGHGNAIAAGGRVTWQAPLIITGGPVEVVSASGQPLGVSQRIFYNDSFNELWAVAESDLESEYYFTWYDNNAAWGMQGNWICIANLGEQSAAVDIYLGTSSTPVKQYTGAERLAPGAVVEWSSPTVRTDGPVRVKSSNGQPLLVSQRVVYKGSFNEINGVGASQLATDYYFAWYDSRPQNGFNGDWILVGNIDDDNRDSARVRITIGGSTMHDPANPGNDYFDVPAGGKVTPLFAGVMDGPVRVTCLDCDAGQKLIVSQRVHYRSSFEEVQGTRPGDLGNFAFFNWYDAKPENGMSGDWLLVGNDSGTPATVFINVGDRSLINPATGTPYFTVGPRSHITPMLSGLQGGPVWVVCTDCYQKNVRLLVSQRVHFKNSFNELIGQHGWINLSR